MPSISVILPVYNADSFLVESVNSILTQTFQDFELLIISNGSNYETLNMLESFKDKRIKHFHLPEPNVGVAMNYGIERSNAAYIARMDADDISFKNRLQEQLNFLVTNPKINVVTGNVEYLGDIDKNRGYYLHVQWLNRLRTHNDMFLNRFVDSPVANPSLMMRREIFEKYGFYKSKGVPEDYEMILRWLSKAVRIAKIDEHVIKWRDHPARLTRNHSDYSSESFFKIKAAYFAKWFLNENKKYKRVLIWGTGKTVYRKSQYLFKEGINVTGYIEVKNNHPDQSYNGLRVIHFKNIPDDCFILNFVSDRKGREKIYEFLINSNRQEGEDFLMMS